MTKEEIQEEYIINSDLPEVKFIIIDTHEKNRYKIINLDNYSDNKDIGDIYLASIARYGENNVKLCEIVSVNTKTTVEFV